MRALSKLVTVNTPDKIVFVGEALVGNEAVDQLSKFDSSLRNFSRSTTAGKGGGEERGVDGMILTKFDTIVSTSGWGKGGGGWGVGWCCARLGPRSSFLVSLTSVPPSLLFFASLSAGRQSRSSPLHDLRDGAADLVRGVWAGQSNPFPLRFSLVSARRGSVRLRRS